MCRRAEPALATNAPALANQRSLSLFASRGPVHPDTAMCFGKSIRFREQQWQLPFIRIRVEHEPQPFLGSRAPPWGSLTDKPAVGSPGVSSHVIHLRTGGQEPRAGPPTRCGRQPRALS
jgi:hypothetical protein